MLDSMTVSSSTCWISVFVRPVAITGIMPLFFNATKEKQPAHRLQIDDLIMSHLNQKKQNLLYFSSFMTPFQKTLLHHSKV